MKTSPINPDGQRYLGRKFTLLAMRIITVTLFYLFGLGLLYAVQHFSPGQQEGFLPALVVLVSIVAILTHLRTRSLEGRERTLFRISELITIAVLLKAFLLFQYNALNLAAEFTAWQNNFVLSFLGAGYFEHLVILLLVWGMTSYLMDLFDQLHDRELDASWEDAGKLSNSLKHIRNQMNAVMVGLLIFLIGIIALSSVSIEIPDLLSFQASIQNPAWLVILFAVLLMTQFSLTQFVLLRSRWELDRASMARTVPRQWLIYGLIFLVVVGIFAGLLPTRYTVSFFELLRGLISILTQIVGLIFYLLTLPFVLLMRLFSGNETPAETPPPVDLPTLFPDTNPALSLPPIFETIRILLFWGLFLSIVGFAFYQLISANKEILKALSSFALVRWFVNIFEQIKVLFQNAGKVLQEQLKRIQISALQSPSIRLPGFFQHSLPKDPRARIIVLYKNLVEYAGSQGIKREDHQTPYQYKEQLEGSLPDVSGEVSDVTEGFVEARYSAHPQDETTANRLETDYSQIKKSLDHRATK